MNATPFKIHDENSYAPTSLKKPAGKLGGGLKPSGLGMNGVCVDKTPLKGGMTGQKSARKGLANLSTSQLNIRSANPSGFKIHTGTEKPARTQKTTEMPNMKALSTVSVETKKSAASTESEFDVVSVHVTTIPLLSSLCCSIVDIKFPVCMCVEKQGVLQI